MKATAFAVDSGRMNADGSHTAEYTCWSNMRQRCYNPMAKHYDNYGGRGIGICKEWQSFDVFLKHMGRKKDLRLTIERLDNDKDYEPGNCVWATRTIQQRNRKVTYKIIRSDGQTFNSAVEAAESIGCDPSSISACVNGRRSSCLGFSFTRFAKEQGS